MACSLLPRVHALARGLCEGVAGRPHRGVHSCCVGVAGHARKATDTNALPHSEHLRMRGRSDSAFGSFVLNTQSPSYASAGLWSWPDNQGHLVNQEASRSTWPQACVLTYQTGFPIPPSLCSRVIGTVCLTRPGARWAWFEKQVARRQRSKRVGKRPCTFQPE